MAEQPVKGGQRNVHIEEVDAEPHSTSHEFDMESDDGSSSSSDSSVPAKYNFYHPLPRTAQSGFVVRLDTWVYNFSHHPCSYSLWISAHCGESIADIVL